MSLQFDLPQHNNIIKVIGVGGGGGNAVNYMHQQGIAGVDFVVCNTDAQVLQLSGIEKKIQLGTQLTEGRGAGMNPDVGKRSALESIDSIKELFAGTKMVFITAGMGKGTGTGAAPVIAKVAKDLGLLTVALVTTPLSVEGPRRYQQAVDGVAELKNHVDTLLVISNDKLREIYGNLKLSEAFSQANNILSNAAKAIAEIITIPGFVNVDFEDVNTVMKNSGVALMGTAVFEGENRAMNAVEAALNSPLLNDNDIRGAKNILINISSGTEEVTLDEVTDITEYVQREAGYDTNIIWGNCSNETLGSKLSVTIIATGFESAGLAKQDKRSTRKKVDLHDDRYPEAKEVIRPRKKTEPSTPMNTIPFEVPETSGQPEMTLQVKSPNEIQDPAINDPVDTPRQDWEVIVMEDQAKAEFELKTREDPLPETKPDEKLDLSTQAKADRVNRLKNLSMKLNNPNAINEMEREPAYLRRSVELKDVPHSSDNSASSYFMGMDENGTPELKRDNSFLHGNDKVD